MEGMEGIKEFLESSSIHGLAYIPTNRRLLRLFWVSVVIFGFTAAGILIQESFSSWSTSPVSTTVEILSISDLKFPNVTVCPPRNSFTSLIPDLVRASNITFKMEQRIAVRKLADKVIFEENLRARYQDYLDFIEDQNYFDFYTGIAKIKFPNMTEIYGKKFKNFEFHSTSFSGSFSTPHFGQTFQEENFDLTLSVGVFITVPSNLTEDAVVCISIEYDIEKTSSLETIKVYVDDVNDGELDKTRTKESYYYYASTVNIIQIRYSRDKESEYSSWTNRRHTGMNVSWFYYSPGQYNEVQYSYTSENTNPDNRFASDNQLLVLLANIFHEETATEQVTSIIDRSLDERRSTYGTDEYECLPYIRKIILSLISFFSSEPTFYEEEMSLETMKKAIGYYFRIFFCPDYDIDIYLFYEKLISNKNTFLNSALPLETFLRTLARVSLEAREKKLKEHHNVAKILLDRIATSLNLQYKDIVALSFPASQLIDFPDQRDPEVIPRELCLLVEYQIIDIAFQMMRI